MVCSICHEALGLCEWHSPSNGCYAIHVVDVVLLGVKNESQQLLL